MVGEVRLSLVRFFYEIIFYEKAIVRGRIVPPPYFDTLLIFRDRASQKKGIVMISKPQVIGQLNNERWLDNTTT